jgi:hypothetical protein
MTHGRAAAALEAFGIEGLVGTRRLGHVERAGAGSRLSGTS